MIVHGYFRPDMAEYRQQNNLIFPFWLTPNKHYIGGILCDPEHPAFADFPTEFHSNLQWWEILNRQQVMNLELFPPEFKPIIQPKYKVDYSIVAELFEKKDRPPAYKFLH